jgi:hypothetical protein
MSRMRNLAVLMLSVPALAAASVDPRPDVTGVPKTALHQDPVAAVGHGAILGADGSEMDPKTDFVIEVQLFYIASVYERADATQRAAFVVLRKQLMKEGMTPEEQVLANSALLAWLVEEVKPDDGTYLLSKDFTLRNRVLAAAGGKAALSAPLFTRLEASGLIGLLAPAAKGGGTDYIERCRAAGVPIPDHWDPADWTRRGLPLPFRFIGASLQAQVFTYETQSGLCIALPRYDGEIISALGIICQGRESSNACFWDNIDVTAMPPGPFPIVWGQRIPLSDFAGAPDIERSRGDICSDCHAGGNAFVVHPGQGMDRGAALVPRRWYTPLVPSSWPQNPEPTTLLESVPLGPADGSCLGCHSRSGPNAIPDVTRLPQYCAAVLKNAVGLPRAPWGTMPLGAVRDPSYYRHISALLEACYPTPATPREVGRRTQAQPVPGRSTTTVPLTSCAGDDCPIGFCYWKALHGPFWQRTASDIPVGAPAYRGSFARIVADGGQWKATTFVDSTGGAPAAEPGGLAECMAFRDIRSVPDANLCGSGLASIFDPDGLRLFDAIDVGGGDTIDVLSGLIGNVAQSPSGPEQLPDRLGVLGDPALGRVELTQRHSPTPPTPFTLGPLAGESWQNGCASWAADYVARDVFSESDARLVASPDSHDVFCFITGIAGAWSSTRAGGSQQPYAEIYRGLEDDVRVRVRPDAGNDRAGAYASCIRFRPRE